MMIIFRLINFKKIHFDIEYKKRGYSMVLLNNHSIVNLIFEYLNKRKDFQGKKKNISL